MQKVWALLIQRELLSRRVTATITTTTTTTKTTTTIVIRTVKQNNITNNISEFRIVYNFVTE